MLIDIELEFGVKTPYDSDEDEGPLDIEDGMDSCIKFVGSNYPCVMRRKKLPDPVEKEKGVSLWSMIKDNIGKDLTRVYRYVLRIWNTRTF
ncbi:hypothetical protein POTOM_058778 [Populus tomentosa]|uniref:Uncharacterized protein n=1 Tax=Populus tomentosa TaxID=118781 RepID=A0A8X7XSH6_POPTO|nr:hypothetical protein POTOM_058778 [Populus tomentosa]